jgi:hypothetical protein
MTQLPRIPASLGVSVPNDIDGYIFWMDEVGSVWVDAKAELTEAFEGSRTAAQNANSFVYVVRNDDLLGRNGPTRAMVAAGLLSAARTAALEGAAKGWTANLIAYDLTVDVAEVMERALFVLANGLTTGEIIHMGPGHIGKALV